MVFGSHIVEYHSGNLQTGVESGESVDERSHAVCHRLGVDHEDYRRIDGEGYLSAAPFPFVVTVEQAHYAFHHGDVGPGGVFRENLPDVLFRRKEGVEVHALAAGGDVMEHRVDVVGSAFERLHPQSAVAQCSEQSHGECSLAAV